MKAELLSFDVQVEIVAEALAGLRRKIIAAGLRRAEETKSHRLLLVVARSSFGAGIEGVSHLDAHDVPWTAGRTGHGMRHCTNVWAMAAGGD